MSETVESFPDSTAGKPMPTQPTALYLSSLDSTMLEPVRECIFVRPVHFHSGKAAALVKLSPPVPGAVFGDNAAEISDVIVTSREEGENLFAIKRFPCHVYIARLRRPGVTTESTLGKADLEILGWGELYRTRTDAAQHVFDAD